MNTNVIVLTGLFLLTCSGAATIGRADDDVGPTSTLTMLNGRSYQVGAWTGSPATSVDRTIRIGNLETYFQGGQSHAESSQVNMRYPHCDLYFGRGLGYGAGETRRMDSSFDSWPIGRVASSYYGEDFAGTQPVRRWIETRIELLN